MSQNVLRWSLTTGRWHQRSRCGRYGIHASHGRHGVRWLCWFYPDGVPLDVLHSAPKPVGVFSMRRSLADAVTDAEHHARTGEILL